LCIDETSIPDRNQQVALMGEIYNKCQRVLIWLGQSVHDSEYMSYYFGPFRLGIPAADKTNALFSISSRTI
ncbi:hypothetical protein BDW02DRAFT_512252, partial [Decorospora gaudefroyi]